MTSTQPARGTRDFLPADVRRREYVISIVRNVYARYGFEPLETPALENVETLLGKYGDEGNKLLFRILRRGEHEGRGEADLALRYDLTVPLARLVARYQKDLPKFFKRYQIQPVWRADGPAPARFREFYQCDIDTIGSTSPVVEAEQIGAVSDVLTSLGFRDFMIRLNHRKALAALEELAALAEQTPARGHIAVDPSLASSLSYYTGAIMEISVPDVVGSLGGGGRYDSLVGMFLGKDVPACGLSLGLEPILDVMTKKEMFPPSVAGGGVDVLVALWSDSGRADTLALASELRGAGLSVGVYPDADELDMQFKYAETMAAQFVAVLGDDERASGSISVKDVTSGEQQRVPRAEATRWIAERTPRTIRTS